MSAWKRFETFDAPGPVRENRLRLTVSQEFVDTHFQVQKLSPLFQVSAHLYGRLPEINLIEMVQASVPPTELTTLNNAYACFEGIKRPHDDEDNGDTVLVYVLRPSVTLQWHQSMTCQARAVIPPPKSVLTALVRTNRPLHDDLGPLDGYVTRLEWVFADGDEVLLPKGSDLRYNKRRW